MKLDVYQGTSDPMLRMVVKHGAGLPRHARPEDWELMPHGTSQLISDAEEDINARGFFFTSWSFLESGR
jgi:hypothetical protein